MSRILSVRWKIIRICLAVSTGMVLAGSGAPKTAKAGPPCENLPTEIAALSKAVTAALPQHRPDDLYREWRVIGLCQTGATAYGYVKSYARADGQPLPAPSDLIRATRTDAGWQIIWPEDTNGPTAAAAANIQPVSGYHLPYAAGTGVYVIKHWYPAVDLQSQDRSPERTTIHNAKAGTVMFVKRDSTRQCGDPPPDFECWKTANTIVIQTAPAEYAWYMHFAPYTIPAEIKEGAWVETGAVLGQEGATGWASSPHVHFMVADSYSCCDGTGETRIPFYPNVTYPVNFFEYTWSALPWLAWSQNGAPLPQPPTAVPTATPEPTPGPQAIVYVPPKETPAVGCANPYTVLPGEWMYRIATKCRVSAAALLAANSQINPQWLMPGQLINMPGGSAAAAAPAATATPAAPAATATPAAPIAAPVAFTGGGGCAETHVVVAGENLFRIAYNCGFSTQQMAARNGLTSPYIIYPGMTLIFP